MVFRDRFMKDIMRKIEPVCSHAAISVRKVAMTVLDGMIKDEKTLSSSSSEYFNVTLSSSSSLSNFSKSPVISISS